MKTLALTSAILDKMPQIGKWQRAFFTSDTLIFEYQRTN